MAAEQTRFAQREFSQVDPNRTDMVANYPCDCTWVEDRIKRSATFFASYLQAVFADGSPRKYDEEPDD